MENEARFRELLQTWKVARPLPATFERTVWERIDRSQRQKPQSFAGLVGYWIDSILPRPATATVYVAVLLVAGVSAGWGQARQDKARVRGELSEKYVQVLDPYLVPGH